MVEFPDTPEKLNELLKAGKCFLQDVRCPKCGGNLYLEKQDDTNRIEIHCLQCAYEPIPPQTYPKPTREGRRKPRIRRNKKI